MFSLNRIIRNLIITQQQCIKKRKIKADIFDSQLLLYKYLYVIVGMWPYIGLRNQFFITMFYGLFSGIFWSAQVIKLYQKSLTLERPSHMENRLLKMYTTC